MWIILLCSSFDNYERRCSVMKVALFYPSEPYSDTADRDRANGITSYLMRSFPVFNLPPLNQGKNDELL